MFSMMQGLQGQLQTPGRLDGSDADDDTTAARFSPNTPPAYGGGTGGHKLLLEAPASSISEVIMHISCSYRAAAINCMSRLCQRTGGVTSTGVVYSQQSNSQVRSPLVCCCSGATTRCGAPPPPPRRLTPVTMPTPQMATAKRKPPSLLPMTKLAALVQSQPRSPPQALAAGSCLHPRPPICAAARAARRTLRTCRTSYRSSRQSWHPRR